MAKFYFSFVDKFPVKSCITYFKGYTIYNGNMLEFSVSDITYSYLRWSIPYDCL